MTAVSWRHLAAVQCVLGKHQPQAEQAIRFARARHRALELWLWSVWLAAA